MWMNETKRAVASEDYGKDEIAANKHLTKHKVVLKCSFKIPQSCKRDLIVCQSLSVRSMAVLLSWKERYLKYLLFL